MREPSFHCYISHYKAFNLGSPSNKSPKPSTAFPNRSMERNSSFGTSWADQWDSSNHSGSSTAAARENKKGGGSGSRWKSGAEKTKAVASSGFKKVKEGTASGFNWIKNKYQQRRTPKH
ncbi:hypothetical protein ZIOFF_071612 [Zingiber officinale]|uniref:Uncharacterized protein n=1 Tax=Zingiber officinale TaxID=94328 RepID=A0A8J5CBR8_ZINOF|nr:hypothetical protein ZIOFF_071612 [Zingiber officinale]